MPEEVPLSPPGSTGGANGVKPTGSADSPAAPVLDIPLPGDNDDKGHDGPKEKSMTAAERCAESMELVAVTQAQGHAFTMEQGRLGMLEGKVGYREGLTHRIIGESGGGQSRAFLPAGRGGVPTAGGTGT